MSVTFPGRPNETFDLVDGYKRFDAQGVLIDSRPLSDGEASAVSDFLAQPGRDASRRALQQSLADALTSIAAAHDQAVTDAATTAAIAAKSIPDLTDVTQLATILTRLQTTLAAQAQVLLAAAKLASGH